MPVVVSTLLENKMVLKDSDHYTVWWLGGKTFRKSKLQRWTGQVENNRAYG